MTRHNELFSIQVSRALILHQDQDPDSCWFGLSAPHPRFPASGSSPLILSPLPVSEGIPAFIRCGKIVPVLNSVEGALSTEHLKTAGLAIVVALNGSQEAEGTLFQDDQVKFIETLIFSRVDSACFRCGRLFPVQANCLLRLQIKIFGRRSPSRIVRGTFLPKKRIFGLN